MGELGGWEGRRRGLGVVDKEGRREYEGEVGEN
jgi:hypothetical protein